ncbi:MAG: hypothetical protein BGO29_15855 [Bacteroidales bacterium 36-12]|nr:MAG: hypothetical protein BGO29_15855 [Bacteroidales bacterium 36-12]
MFYIFYAFIWLLSWLPLNVLYVLSDIMYFVIYYVAGYRRKVVRRNLINSFPDYSTEKIINIEKKFYRYFSDLMVEIIRQLNAPASDMKRRMTIENLELINKQAARGQSVMLMYAHYGNWEWSSTLCLSLPDHYKAFPVYRKLKNTHFDQLMIRLRNRYGAESIEKDSLVRKIWQIKQTGESGIFGMISDQTPRWKNIRCWMTFLNQDTPVFLGTEQLAKKYNYPVFYLDIQPIKRGYYKANIIPIALDPANTEEFEITTKFMRILEERINEKPEYWLWTHKRWKHKKNN